MPSKTELYTQLVRQLNSGIQGLVYVLNSPINGLANVLQRRVETAPEVTHDESTENK